MIFRHASFLSLSLALLAAFTAAPASAAETLPDHTAPAAMTAANFAEPPQTVKPWCYYWQLKGNTSKELITRDLENMAELGFGGLLVFDSRRYWDDYASTTHVPVPLEIKYEYMSEGWQEMMTWLVQEAARLNLQVSFNISDSGGQLRGPWDMKDLGPYELIWTEGNLDGPKTVELEMTVPEDKAYYSDVALYGVRICSATAQNRESVKLNETWGQIVIPEQDAPQYDEVVDLSANVQDGKLRWDVPDGHWKVLRFGSTRIGEPGCVDILNAKSVDDYFNKMPGTLLDDVGDLAGKTLTHFYNVSWEGVHPNWTDGFDAFFAERREYPIYDFLPVLRGLRPVGGNLPAGAADRFVEDYLKTISESFCANCYETIGKRCHERGVRWHSEDGGPWNRKSPLFREADMLSFWGQNDFPQGEFWVGEKNQTNTAFAAMAAHIYGRRDVSLEAFTHMRKHWSVYPSLLKPYANSNFASGGNFMIWHTYTASMPEWGKPGFEYFAGTHVNSNVTWQPYVKPFLKYMTRCQQLLRQGVNAADVCVYMSDRNYEMWGTGEKWNAASKLVLPKGLHYDLLDTKTLVERLEYKDGLLVLPGGAKYRLLVFDPNDDVVPRAAMLKLRDLAKAGAPILLGEHKPTRSVGLSDAANADADVADCVEALWNAADADGSAFAGVKTGVSVQSALDALGVLPDFEGPFQFTKRVLDDPDAGVVEIYFVAARDGESGDAECVFRAKGASASLWDPETGAVSALSVADAADGRKKAQVTLPVDGAAFVVFSDAPYAESAIPAETRSRVLELTAPWTVSFDPEVGGPGVVTFEKLTRWDASDVPGIKHYGGTAVYSTEFELSADQASQDLVLTLGELHDIADVRLNGVSLGVVWSDPWEIRLADAAKPGKNTLEIDVTNCWQNRLIGDAALPVEERITKTPVVLEKEPTHTMYPWRGYLASDPLAPAGLVGPVRVEAVKTGL